MPINNLPDSTGYSQDDQKKRTFKALLSSLPILTALLVIFTGLVAFTWAVRYQQKYRTKAQITTSSVSTINYSIDKILGQPDDKETMTNLITQDRGFLIGGVHVDSQNRIYVFDSGNNRILGFRNYALNKPADIVIGQSSFDAKGTANLDNTKYLPPSASTLALLPYPSLNSTLEGGRMGQMATDSQGNFFVVDLNNNRVLKFNDPFTTDAIADEIWGQQDFTSRQSHCGQGGFTPDASTLCTEWGTEFNGTGNQVFASAVEIDPEGNMWVADTGNNRVLRFPTNGSGGINKVADIVLGQTNLSSRTARNGFDTSLSVMQKPLGIKYDSVSNELYVLEGEWAGQARILTFTPPFTTGMSATREIGRATFQDAQPPDTTNWENIQGKWVHVTTGVYWPRGMGIDPEGRGIWVTDTGNQRILLFSRLGHLLEVIGQPDTDTRGCFGWGNQGFIGPDSQKYNICDAEGEIGIVTDANGYKYLFIGNIGNADPKNVVRFEVAIRRNPSGLAISDGWLLASGRNKFSGKTFENGYGMSFSKDTQGEITQLFASDRQRVLVWNNPTSTLTFNQADYVIGQDTFTENLNNNGGIFSGVEVSSQTTGGNHLWVSANDRIFAFALPITASGKNLQPTKVLYSGESALGNVFWNDDNQKVNFRAKGMVFNQAQNSMWIADEQGNRVFRIVDPLGNARVDVVLGQPDKNSNCDNACLGTRNAKGFADPWAVQFDNLGNLYVVDSKYEGGANNRVLRFNANKLQPIPTIFPFPDADGVYAKKDFTTDQNWGPGTPQNPIWVTFDSENRMLLLVDSYGNKQYERAFVYDTSHASQITPQPTHVLPIAFGQAAVAYYLSDNQHLLIQDHTWNRVLFVSLTDFPPSPTPTSAPTATPAPELQEFDDTSPRVTYNSWRGVFDQSFSGGSYRASTISAQIRLDFPTPSDKITVTTYKGPDQGKAKIYLDDVLKGTYDLYSPTPELGYTLTFSDLPRALHWIRLNVLATKNKLSSGKEVRVDKFSDGVTDYEDTDQLIRFDNWVGKIDTRVSYQGGYHYTAGAGKTVMVDFVGDSITWLTRECRQCGGQAEIFIDDVSKAIVNFYNPEVTSVYEEVIDGLPYGPHTLKIKVLGKHDAGQGTSNNVYIDGFRVP